jgi:YHS domain-containing protein
VWSYAATDRNTAFELASGRVDEGETSVSGANCALDDGMDGNSHNEEVKGPMEELQMQPMAKDPVCGMEVNPEIARAQGLASDHQGETYYFCGKGCKLDFDDEPAKFFETDYQPHM